MYISHPHIPGQLLCGAALALTIVLTLRAALPSDDAERLWSGTRPTLPHRQTVVFGTPSRLARQLEVIPMSMNDLPLEPMVAVSSPTASWSVARLLGPLIAVGALVGAMLHAAWRTPSATVGSMETVALCSSTALTTPPIKLTYFAIEGAAEKVRLALVLAGIPFEDVHVSFSDWQKLKPTTKFGQLPLMVVDGGAPIAQSEAMLRYVGRLDRRLYPEAKALQVDEVIGLVGDLAKALMPGLYLGMRPAMFGYPEGYQTTDEGKATMKRVREAFAAGDLPRFLAYFDGLLGDQPFIVGEEPTLADCVLVPTLRSLNRGVIEHVPATCMDAYPRLHAYVSRFMALPKVKAFYDAKPKP